MIGGRCLLAHDLGTSGNKAALFSEDGFLLGSCTVPYPVHYSRGGVYAEQNPEDWWHAVCKSTKLLLEKTGCLQAQICAVSFSGQMMGCLCLDREGKPIRPAIIWADRRAKAQEEALRRIVSDEAYYGIVGHPNSASYGLHKLLWLRDQEPEVYGRTDRVLGAKDYIVYRLTGKAVTDCSDANSFGFYDLKKSDWSDVLLDAMGLTREKLPPVLASSTLVGGVTGEASEACGLLAGTPVILGAGDGAAANVGAGSVRPGTAYCCLGTSAWIASTSDEPLLDPQRRTVTWAHMVSGLYAPNGTMQAACASYAWLRRALFEPGDDGAVYENMNALAAESPRGAGGVLFLPYLLGERAPRWDPHASGCFVGLTPETSRGDLIRAVMEGVAMNLALILDVLRSRTPVERLNLIGGGARSTAWQQILADVTGMALRIPSALEEAGSIGAAVNAGVGVGLYADYDAVDRFLRFSARVPAAEDAGAVYGPIRQRFETAYRALRPFFREASEEP
ncbi:MAG: xylulokinase [Oscillospiraceae bacterium]|nr:xylulokinase [Oscillospiraceae bacterium]